MVMGVWFVSDNYQTRELKNIFQIKLSERFSIQAKEHRTRFDKHIKSYNQAAKLYSRTREIIQHVSSDEWQSRSTVKIYTSKPEWVPEYSVMRKFIVPRNIILFDKNRKFKEGWHIYNQDITNTLSKIDDITMHLAEQQSYLSMLGNTPYLITIEPIKNYSNTKTLAYLMLSSPLDSEFLTESQHLASTSNTVALLAEDQQTVMVSSNPERIPYGSRLDAIKDYYQTIGEGFFDYGSSDLVIRFVSFISLEEVEHLTETVLYDERIIRLFTGITYTLIFIVIALLLTRRLQNLTQRIVEFSNKMSIQLPVLETHDELVILEERFKALSNAIKNETDALEHQASHDPLTNLPNRKKLNEELQSSLIRNAQDNTKLILMLGDLNHFKEINDTLGHHIGDLVLQQAAERLYNTVRKTDTVARLGGDEFGILLPDIGINEAVRIVDNITKEFESPFIAEDQKLNLGISIGIVESPTHGDDVNILIQRADVAMYNAKQQNLDYTIYDPNLDEHHVSKLQLMTELRYAIKNKKLELYFQPKHDTLTGTIIGAEALIRWNHPVRGTINPDEFIPLAKQTGLIKLLTRWVIEASILQCTKWHNHNFNLGVSINISTQCLHDQKLVSHIAEQFRKHSLSSEYFTLEIPESEIMTNPIRAKSVLNEIKNMGVNISIDDFGTGYSSLAYLKQLPVNEVKIDRSFIVDMQNDDSDKTIVHAIINLAGNLGHKVVAEGVENKKVMELLTSYGCDYVQGIYISSPLPAEKFLKQLLAGRKKQSIA